MTTPVVEGLCGLCGTTLVGYTHHLSMGEVHDSCMVAFWYGATFQRPDGSRVTHNQGNCGFCSIVFIPFRKETP